ncbi:Lsr2 family protein [Microbacterium capsulatum]|uniref:Lsr2 family protein n=1 Tax=Microbacterium capsulatum TaxID=3041921 RepID=A0ABU0XIV7_9MICO|nr:Lsr2 family protein [Microbacterium sp. ASV81]MDQ4214065.1 Lsr2 family protein [Microbacterium sp. ASV81]
MGKRTIEELFDDIDGGQATSSITFGLDGSNYEIDLNDANAEKLRAVFAPWLEVARRVPKNGAPQSRTPRSRRGNANLTGVREWAKENGHKVSDRGRIPADVLAAYEAAR